MRSQAAGIRDAGADHAFGPNPGAPGRVGRARRLVGDSAGGPELGWAGTRHVADARRVRFESDRIELDLQIEPIASGGALTGQLSRLDPEALPLARARILATGDDLAMVEAETDELGEFAVEIGNVKGIVLRVVDESRLTVFAIPDVDPAP